MTCKCTEHRFIIQRRDGTGERIICKSIAEVQKQADELRLSDPIGVTTRQYEVVEESSYYLKEITE